MKVCANLTAKPTSSDGTEKQILPHSLHDSMTAVAVTREHESSSSSCEERMESSLFLVLSFIVGLCVIGTFVSIGGVLYLRYRSSASSSTTTRQNHKIISVIQSPTAMHLKMDNEKTMTMRMPTTSSSLSVLAQPTTTSTTDSTIVTVQDVEERLIPDPVTGTAVVTESPLPESSGIKSLITTAMPTFVTVRNQWNLEQPPSARQLLQAVKQFFQFFRTGRYEVDKTR